MVPPRPSLPQGPNSRSSACLCGAEAPWRSAAHLPAADRGREADSRTVATTPAAAPAAAQLPEGGQRLPGKRRQNSHGATGLLFKKGSDVTVWWQESHPASFPSSHNNPAPENRPLGAGRQRAPRGRERKPQGLGRTHTGWKQPAPQACSSVPLTSADAQISHPDFRAARNTEGRPFRSHPCWSKADSA